LDEILRKWSAPGERLHGMRATDLDGHLTHAVNLVFLPTEDDVLAARMRRSFRWKQMVAAVGMDQSFVWLLLSGLLVGLLLVVTLRLLPWRR
jgi:hypothetical protein